MTLQSWVGVILFGLFIIALVAFLPKLLPPANDTAQTLQQHNHMSTLLKIIFIVFVAAIVFLGLYFLSATLVPPNTLASPTATYTPVPTYPPNTLPSETGI